MFANIKIALQYNKYVNREIIKQITKRDCFTIDDAQVKKLYSSKSYFQEAKKIAGKNEKIWLYFQKNENTRLYIKTGFVQIESSKKVYMHGKNCQIIKVEKGES